MQQKIKQHIQRLKLTTMLYTRLFTSTLAGYSVKDINSNWKIKVRGLYNGKKINKLVGVSGLVALIGEELAGKFTARAFRDMLDKCVCKLRRGLVITFYAF